MDPRDAINKDITVNDLKKGFRRYKDYSSMSVPRLVQELEKVDERERTMYEDPMTEAMGAPTEDFQRDFDAEKRNIAAVLVKKAKPGSTPHRMAMRVIESFMP